jgi:hypothetical protein
MGSGLLRKDLILAGDYAGLEELVRETLALISRIRGQ